MTKHTFEKYAPGYLRLWNAMTVRPEYAGTVSATARRIFACKGRYLEVEAKTGVPWWFVGITHKMECEGLSFAKHLHNGDSLAKRTWQVPAGRPAAGSPPFTWLESAVDALRIKGLHQMRPADWTLKRTAYEFERFNGFGYRKFNIASPYLWSFSNNYTRGKYIRDGVWDSREVSGQSGAMLLLRALMDLDPAIRVAGSADAPEPPRLVEINEDERLPKTPSDAQALAKSRTLFGVVLAFFGWIASKVSELVGWLSSVGGILTDAADAAGSISGPAVQLAGYVGASLPWIGGVAVLYGLGLAIHARVTATTSGKIG